MIGTTGTARTATAEPSALRPTWLSIGLPDVLFIFLSLAILQKASMGMMDDPGLGWHLRIPDQMWEWGGFLREEAFCQPTLGRPWVTQAWLGDLLFRTVYWWGGLNAIAVLTTLTITLVLRILYVQMRSAGVPWPAALGWTFLATLGTATSWVARPNVFTFLGLVLTVQICRQFHRGEISTRGTLWLVPLFALWPNMHGGFLAGVIALCVTYATEWAVVLGAAKPDRRVDAWRRIRWWTGLGPVLFAATLVNPYGLNLHLWNVQLLTDSFIQSGTTEEWLPPDFGADGWFRIELLILLLPLLAASSRLRIDAVSLMLCVVWLHFALTARRYSPLWVVVAAPVLAELSCRVPWIVRIAGRLKEGISDDLRHVLTARAGKPAWSASAVFAMALLLVSPWLGQVARHDPKYMPAAALDRLLAEYRGERVFHSVNWGGYLIWHGWSCQPRLKTWIDDRLDVHGPEHMAEYFSIISAASGWQQSLDRHAIGLLCIPTDSRLAEAVAASSQWKGLFREQGVAAFRRAEVVGATEPAPPGSTSPAAVSPGSPPRALPAAIARTERPAP